MDAARVVAWLTAALVAAGCGAPPAFECGANAACDLAGGGVCEVDGRCSYPDGDCPSGRRYGAGAGGAAGTCVGGDGDPADGGPAGVCPDGWTRRVQVRFINDVGPGDSDALVDAPVLVRLSDAVRDDLGLAAELDDLRVGDADGAALPFEIEDFDQPDAHVWIRVPAIDAASAADHVWLFGGRAGAPAAEQPAAVWDAGFRGVWHFAELLNPRGGTSFDSTAHGNHATGGGGGQTVVGLLGTAVELSGGLGLDVADDPSLAGLADFTLEAVYHLDEAGPGDSYALDATAYELVVTYSGLVNPHLYVALQGGGEVVLAASEPTAVMRWQYVAATFQAGGDAHIYVDGVPRGDSGPVGQIEQAALGPLTLGEFVDGRLDEVRISSVARSPAWIAAQARVIDGSFAVVGTVEPCQ